MNKKLYIIVFFGIALLAATGAIWATNLSQTEATVPSFAIGYAKNHNFIRYEENALDFHGNRSRWDLLFQRFEKLVFNGQGKISIVHMGGSHVQGGALTDRLRKNFSRLTYGTEGARGFVFPYKMAGTNSPNTIQCSWTGNWEGHRSSVSTHRSEWGMSGITATTQDSSASVQLSVHNGDSVYYAFDKVKIYYTSTPNMSIILDTMVKTLNVRHYPEKGYMEWTFTPSMTELSFGIQRTDSLPGSFTLQGVYLHNNNDGITYNTIGVNGAGTYSYLRCPMFNDQIATLNADMVVFGIGINDANVAASDFNREVFEARYDSLIQQFLRVNPQTCFVFITNNDTYYNKKYPNKNALLVQQAMFNLAQRYDGAVWDFFEIMGGLGSINHWVNNGLAARDKIHFTRSGYELEADMFYEAFAKSFGDYLGDKSAN